MITAPVFGAYSVSHGLEQNIPAEPKLGDLYIATDTKTTYVCYERGGEWERVGEIKNEIRMFAGLETSIPKGWHLCNGENGTPDLRNRFIVGAGDSYVFADEGGENAHTLTVDEMPSHKHSYGISKGWGDLRASSLDLNSTPTEAYSSAVGGDLPHENRPPYFALCFIMRVEI